jgi:exodeoxyribonuclease VII small subunit
MSPPEEDAPKSFEESLHALEAIVCDLEDGQIGLTESLAKYEQGVKLLKECYALLQNAERRIELLTRLDSSGAAITEPFDDTPSASENAGNASPAAARSRRRSAKSSKEKPSSQANDDSDEIDVPGGLF